MTRSPRPRRCECGIPILILPDGRVVDDREGCRGEPHDDCYWEGLDLGEPVA